MTTIVSPFHLDQRLEGFEAPINVDRLLAPELRGGSPWERMVYI
jgi:hypothetical protein